MRELVELSEAARELALSRLQLLEPHLEQGRPLRSVAEEAGAPFRTAGRWVSLYRQHGLAGLVRKARTDRGNRRVLSQEMRRLIEGLALERPRLPCQSIHRQVCHFAAEKGEPRPSYWMVPTVVREIAPGLLSLAHDGPKAYSEAFDLVHRREASRPNAIWQADHAQMDILLVREDGSSGRPWLTIIIDDYSRAVAGYYLAFDPPSVLRIALALRQGIWRKEDPHWPVCGIPSVLYTDHGADFTSQHMRQAAADIIVVARNWKSGRSPGDIDLIAWEGETLCFVDVGTRTPRPASEKMAAGPGRRPDRLLRSLAADYLIKASLLEVPTRFDLILADFKQDKPHAQQAPGDRRPNPELEYLRGAF